MAQKYHLQVTIDDDREALRLRVLGDGAEMFSTRLEAPELDDLIRALGDGRAQLTDEVAPELDEGARITNTILDPSYLVAKNSGRGEALLAFRHPGFGWLGFQLRRSVIQAVVDRLGAWLRENGGR